MDESAKSPDELASDAKAVGRDAVDKAKAVASDAAQVANEAVDTGRAYARDAVNEAGKRIGNARSQLSQSCSALVQAIHDEPVKAVVVTAVLSSALTALLMAAMPRADRY